jgi:hypothetical protein
MQVITFKKYDVDQHNFIECLGVIKEEDVKDFINATEEEYDGQVLDFEVHTIH